MRRRAVIAGAAVVAGVVVAAAVVTIAVISAQRTTESSVAPFAVPSAAPSAEQGMTGAVLREVDGGADYYSRFDDGLPGDPGFFPIGVWFASVTSGADVHADALIGINTYVELTANSSVPLITEAGMQAIPSLPAEGAAGFLVADEVDMWAGPGDGTWTGAYPGEGQVCEADAACGYSIMAELVERVASGTMTVANFGKGVAFWESDQEARPFMEYTDVVSLDTYWFTDPNICGETEGGWGPGNGAAMPEEECRLAANYGWTVEHARSLVAPSGSKPVWGFVEVGQPFGDSSMPAVTGPQIRAAVWSSIIHGARGVVYFNHSFGGGCTSANVLRDECGDPVRADVAALNQELAALAPALNAPFVDGLVTVDGHADVAVKLVDDGFTVIAGSTRAGAQRIEFTSGCAKATTAEVLGENRSIPVVDGRFGDEFANGDAVHVYRMDGGSCGL